ncbi:MAG: multicopper oxidase domain-containing protein, partial [Lysobacterales bacterium]
ELLVPASGRSDAVVVPTGSDGDVVRIVGLEVHRGGPIGTAAAIGDLLHIEIDDSEPDPGAPFAIAQGNEVLGAGGIEDVKSETISDFYVPVDGDPTNTDNPGNPANPGYSNGSDSPFIELFGTGAPGQATIDGVVGHYEHSGPDYTQVPYQGAARYARTGDLLEFTITNPSSQHHPFHHHGFSFQPVRVIDLGSMTHDPSDDTVLYEFDYNEWVDTIDVTDKQGIVVRMRLDDRERITDNRPEAGAPAPDQLFLSGGAAGRWVFHCHLFLHAAIGMISELVVEDTDRDMDGFDTSMDCNDFDPGVYPGAEECDASLDNNCDGFVEGDTSDPEVTAPDDVVEECSGPGGQAVDLGLPTVTDNCDVSPFVENDAPATFPLGLTVVTWSATDESGNTGSDTQNVTIQDTTPPDISVEVSPDQLWAPNHKMVKVTAIVEAADICDANPLVTLLSVVSNEDDNGLGDGDTNNDIVIVDDLTVRLRAERSGKGVDRVYTLTYQAEDASGNTSTAEATVTVPHEQY